MIPYDNLLWIIMNYWYIHEPIINKTEQFEHHWCLRWNHEICDDSVIFRHQEQRKHKNCSETLNIWKYIVILWYDMNRNRLKCEGYKHRNIEQLHDMFSSMPRHTSCDKFTVQSKWTWNLGRCITITKLSFPSSMLHAPFFEFF